MMRRAILFLILLFPLCAAAQDREQWLRPDTRIPYRDVAGKLIVDVEIGGKVRPFIFDTGAAKSFITDSLYAELGLDSLRSVLVRDSGNIAKHATLSKTDTLRIGDWTMTELPLIVTDSDNPIFECFEVEGVVGSDILYGRTVRFQSRDSVILLTSGASAYGLRKKEGIKVLLRGGCPIIRTTFESGRKRGSSLVLFDSGAADFGFNVYALAALERKGVVPEKEQGIGRRSYGFHGAENETEQYRGFFPRFGIGGEMLERVPFGTTASRSSLLGTFLLKYGDVTIDYSQKRFYFEPFDVNQVVEDPQRKAISPFVIDGQWIVGVVWDEMLKASIQAGDRIVSLDGRSAEEYEFCDYMNGRGKPFPKGTVARVENCAGEIIEIIL